MERTHRQPGGEPELEALIPPSPALIEPEPRESWDERVIREGIDAAVNEGRAIDNRTARYIAGQLHDGQGSAVYALASSGAIQPDVYDELDCGQTEQPDAVRRWIAALSVYCATRAGQGPVDGWVEEAEAQDRAELFNQISRVGRPLGEIATVSMMGELAAEAEADTDEIDDVPWTDAASWRPDDEAAVEDEAPDAPVLSAEQLEALSSDEVDEDIGSAEDIGWYGLLRWADQPGGAIHRIDSDGLKDTWVFRSNEALDTRWAAIASEHEEFCEQRDAYEAATEELSDTPSGVMPRIWVGSLADYNNGELHGAWFDATRESVELTLATKFMLRLGHTPDAEEWAVMDYDGFAGIELGEYESFGTISRIAQGLAEHGEAFGHWAAYVGAESEEALGRFEDHYRGEWDSFKAYIENYLEETEFYGFLNSVPEDMRGYVEVDVEQIARDWSCDYHTIALHNGQTGVFDARD
jgi:antirestriction protein